MFIRTYSIPLHSNSIFAYWYLNLNGFCNHVSIFDQYISVYNGVTDNVGTTTLLGNFLRSKRHISRILDLRRETDERRKKAIKLSLPSGTASGWFAPERKIEYLQRHSGFICIDIDGKDNPDHTMEDVRGLLVSRDDVAYAALSVGGKGMFALLPLAWPDRHEEQFDALKLDFKEQYGITLDKACRDVTRLRVLSYDENPYVNEDAKRYEGIEVFTPNFAQPSLVGADGDLRKVQRCVDQIVEFGIDITQTYQDWYTIGVALASLGEEGRYYFHKVSSVHPEYKYHIANKKFNDLLRTRGQVGLGTFFYWCQQYGITYKRQQP